MNVFIWEQDISDQRFKFKAVLPVYCFLFKYCCYIYKLYKDVLKSTMLVTQNPLEEQA